MSDVLTNYNFNNDGDVLGYPNSLPDLPINPNYDNDPIVNANKGCAIIMGNGDYLFIPKNDSDALTNPNYGSDDTVANRLEMMKSVDIMGMNHSFSSEPSAIDISYDFGERPTWWDKELVNATSTGSTVESKSFLVSDKCANELQSLPEVVGTQAGLTDPF